MGWACTVVASQLAVYMCAWSLGTCSFCVVLSGQPSSCFLWHRSSHPSCWYEVLSGCSGVRLMHLHCCNRYGSTVLFGNPRHLRSQCFAWELGSFLCGTPLVANPWFCNVARSLSLSARVVSLSVVGLLPWPTPMWGSQWECNTAAELNIQVHCHVAGDICGGSSPSPSPSPAPPAPTPPSYYWSSVAVHGFFVVHPFVSFYCTHLVFWPLFGTCGLFMVALMWVMAASRAPTIVS